VVRLTQISYSSLKERQAEYIRKMILAISQDIRVVLVKLADRQEIERNDWSLTPGRYVGVAPQEVDEDFDFEQTMREIHVELAELNLEAEELAAKIQANFEGLGI